VPAPRSGCGKEFSWTKQGAYVGKVSDREGRVVDRSGANVFQSAAKPGNWGGTRGDERQENRRTQ
jgi:hypothetical protein